jgi:hypothetical protein
MVPDRARRCCFIAAVAALVALLLPTSDAAAANYVIPAGQDELMGTMLGNGDEALPGNCMFNGASIQQTRITANYVCGADGKEVVIELHHPDEGAKVRTQQFALVPIVGDPPPELLPALVERIQRTESQWKWNKLGGDVPQTPGAKVLERTSVPSGTHWILPVALLLLVLSRVRARPGVPRVDIGLTAAVFIGGALLRLALGPYGPFRINGLGPMWLDGAISDPGQLYGYGPGYPEIFSLIARLAPSAPDVTIFVANGVISALVPALAHVLARLVGFDRTRALIPASLLALDPIALRVATTESYTPAIITLTLLGSVLLVAAALHAHRREWPRVGLLALAAGLVLSQSVRIHPVAWIPAALAPLTVLAVGDEVTALRRLISAAVATLIAGLIIALTSGSIVEGQLALLRHSEVMAPSRPMFVWWFPVLAVALGFAAFRWARPRWLIIPALLQLGALAATRHDFAQSFVWQQSYDRLYLAIPLVALAAFIRESWTPRRVVRGGLVAAGALLLVASAPIWRGRTTDHLEYRWVRKTLDTVPRECLVVYVGQVGNRNMMLPIFGPPAKAARKAIRLDADSTTDLPHRLAGSPCTMYVHTTFCASTDGGPVCDRVENLLDLEPVASERFPAVSSNRYVRYDRPPIETVISKVRKVR